MNTSIMARESEFGHNYTVVRDGSHGYQQPESESATRSAHLLRHFSISTMVGDPTCELSLHVVTEASRRRNAHARSASLANTAR